MKNSTIVTVVLGVAVALLYLLHFIGNKSSMIPKGNDNSESSNQFQLLMSKWILFFSLTNWLRN